MRTRPSGEGMRGLQIALALLVRFGLGTVLGQVYLADSDALAGRHECIEEMTEVRSRMLRAPDVVFDYRYEVGGSVEVMRDWEFLIEREDGQGEGTDYAFRWGPSEIGCQVEHHQIEPYFGGER
jgi:hypothetical protein